jgi:hypothetical protein
LNRFEKAEPQVFRVGDIVEVQISFVVTPAKDGKHNMRATLRSIALIDGTYSAVSKLGIFAVTSQCQQRKLTFTGRIEKEESSRDSTRTPPHRIGLEAEIRIRRRRRPQGKENFVGGEKSRVVIVKSKRQLGKHGTRQMTANAYGILFS